MWPGEKHHLCSWVLSVETAREHYPDTWLVTDDDGARMLVDGIGLQFAHVSTDLNVLSKHDPNWWTLGKIYAYRLQTQPFVHIDSDVFLWKRLPARVEEADIFAQHPNLLSPGTWYYQPDRFEHAINSTSAGWLPSEWYWYRRAIINQRAESTGLMGGNRCDFINRYAEASQRLINEPGNQLVLQSLTDKHLHSLLIEEYLLAAFIEYYRALSVSPFGDIQIEYLFTSDVDMWNPDRAVQVGFTHLVAWQKKNPLLADKLVKRVQWDYPYYYERIIKYLNSVE